MRAWRRSDWTERSCKRCGQPLETFGVGGEILAGELHSAFFGSRFALADFTLVDGSSQQQPGGELHQPGGQPHALGRIGQGVAAQQKLGLVTARPIEIGGRVLDERHAFFEQGFERSGTRELLAEKNRSAVICDTRGFEHDALPIAVKTPSRMGHHDGQAILAPMGEVWLFRFCLG